MYLQNAAEVVVHESGFCLFPREEGNNLTVIGEYKTIQI
ncbi:hypothetical protein OTSSIDO_0728 [Orientia tsutsugamushi str. Sido]|nr:hypothetical protein OTSSIDO_0728 [Orientia tsutsugamushi str. Sido]